MKFGGRSQRCLIETMRNSVAKPKGGLGFLGGSDSKESTCKAGEPGSIPGSGRSPGEGNGYPLQYSCLENSMDRGDWQPKSQKSDTTELPKPHFSLSKDGKQSSSGDLSTSSPWVFSGSTVDVKAVRPSSPSSRCQVLVKEHLTVKWIRTPWFLSHPPTMLPCLLPAFCLWKASVKE